jgi:hypothetical protein
LQFDIRAFSFIIRVAGVKELTQVGQPRITLASLVQHFWKCTEYLRNSTSNREWVMAK